MNKYVADFLSARASVRTFDPTATVTPDEVRGILNLAATAPSTNNTQPWKVLAITNKEVQKKLRLISFNQAQLETAAGVFLIFGDAEGYDIDALAKWNIDHNILAEQDADAFKAKMEKFYAASPAEHGPEELMLDCGLFSMNLMYAIRTYGFESVAMRGTDFPAMMQYLEVPSTWLPVLLLPFGKASAPGYAKMRRDAEEFTTFID